MAVIVGGYRLLISAVFLPLLNAASIGIGNTGPTEEFNVARVQRDTSALGPPTRIRRVKVSMMGTKVVMGDSSSVSKLFDLYQLRLSWTEPEDWHDNFDDFSRHYELDCWVEDQNGDRKTVVSRLVGAYFSGYHEKYRFPPGVELAIRCQVRAINSAGFATPWRASNRINVKDIPVYFPGIHDIDLRGLSEEDILAALSKSQQQ